jgi:hypothetical protein
MTILFWYSVTFLIALSAWCFPAFMSPPYFRKGREIFLLWNMILFPPLAAAIHGAVMVGFHMKCWLRGHDYGRYRVTCDRCCKRNESNDADRS